MPRTLIATYRLQLHEDFRFEAAAQVAGYLQQLGISHVYCSPYLQAAPHSKHGYDVVDHHKLNAELGGAEGHSLFLQRLEDLNLGQVLDIVPNHMAISGRLNRYWWDILENGPASIYASYFDIDWQPREQKLRNKLLVPILGDHYGRALSRGEIKIERNGGEFSIRYFDNELPAAPRSLPAFLMEAAEQSGSDFFVFLVDALRSLPGPGTTDEAGLNRRHRDKEVIRTRLEKLFTDVPYIADNVDATIRAINASPDRLDAVLEAQNFRLAFWRTAEQDLGYRRFFDVNTLVGLRMENKRVFADAHRLILSWVREGRLDGLRVDHPDGLLDPWQYFDRLRKKAPEVWILGEKILEPGETLRANWPIDGTTGYDYLNEAGGLFVDSGNEEQFNTLYAEFTGESTDYAAVSRDKKHRVLRDLLGSDVNRLTAALLEICECHRNHRDYTRHDVIRAIRELVACFPIYRTYVVPDRAEIDPEDIRYINAAIDASKANRPEIDPDLFDFIRDLLLLKVTADKDNGKESDFVLRFQQFTGPAMAKGVEDTVFYNFNRLIALNEVGGDPGRFGVCPADYHRFCADTQRGHPKTMLASSTHDTKRSEDVRARISLLSEMPDRWREAIARWSAMNAAHRTNGMPDANTEYFLYQTFVGAWPIGTDRLLPYMEKATRESKQHTSWLSPNKAFEDATKHFVESICADFAFQTDLENFVRPLINPGRVNSLAILLLKLTSPGIPDIYQGTELWDLSLVDPDNRRPVDYPLRRDLLGDLPGLSAQEILARSDDGLPKLWTLVQALKVRREQPDSFGPNGHYEPILANGPKADHIVAYRRGEDVIAVVPRLIIKLNSDWGDTGIDLPPGAWRNRLTGDVTQEPTPKLNELLARFPVALLVKE